MSVPIKHLEKQPRAAAAVFPPIHASLRSTLYRLRLREKLSTSEVRRRRAERAKVDVRRALAAAIDANR